MPAGPGAVSRLFGRALRLPGPAVHVGMDPTQITPPLRGRHVMLDEALDLVDAARADGVDARIVGGLAVLALCADPARCRRDHRDFDLVAPRRQAGRLLATFARLGYEENRHVRLASSGALLQVYRPCPHADPQGHALHPDDRVDVYLDDFRLHHALPLRRRLRREAYTLPPSDVLLAKLLRTRMSDTDVRDVAALLLDVPLRDEDAAGAIGLHYLAHACARDWGLYHDVTGNLGRVAAEADALGFDAAGAQAVTTACSRLLAALDSAGKGLRWRLRAAVGERLPWYDAVDENDGQRIGLRERPAPARPSTGPGTGLSGRRAA
jgi:hypothetical protein